MRPTRNTTFALALLVAGCTDSTETPTSPPTTQTVPLTAEAVQATDPTPTTLEPRLSNDALVSAQFCLETLAYEGRMKSVLEEAREPCRIAKSMVTVEAIETAEALEVEASLRDLLRTIDIFLQQNEGYASPTETAWAPVWAARQRFASALDAAIG